MDDRSASAFMSEYRAALDAQVEAAAEEERLDEARKKLVAAMTRDAGEIPATKAAAFVTASDEYQQATDELLLARKALAAAKAKVRWLEVRFDMWKQRSMNARAKQWRDQHASQAAEQNG